MKPNSFSHAIEKKGQAMKTTKREYRPYNGHPNWKLWNISMWISNDYATYQYAVSLLNQYSLKQSTEVLWEELKGQSTPDGAEYSKAAIRYALSGLL